MKMSVYELPHGHQTNKWENLPDRIGTGLPGRSKREELPPLRYFSSGVHLSCSDDEWHLDSVINGNILGIGDLSIQP
jgi:hypothetical protein